MSLATRQQAARVFPALVGRLAVPGAQETSKPLVPLPDWLKPDYKPAKEIEAKSVVAPPQPAADQPESTCSTSTRVEGVYYEVYVGGRLKLYSSKKQEEHLRSMHDVNHKELPIARLAARVADFLWPNCQEMIDAAVANSKKVSRQRIRAEEEEFVPPEVPHFLPFTNWLRNSAVLRESFVCDQNTRYKPRMTWYNPNDGMFPSGWWKEGLLGDLAYYKPLSGLRQPEQKW